MTRRRPAPPANDGAPGQPDPAPASVDASLGPSRATDNVLSPALLDWFTAPASLEAPGAVEPDRTTAPASVALPASSGRPRRSAWPLCGARLRGPRAGRTCQRRALWDDAAGRWASSPSPRCHQHGGASAVAHRERAAKRRAEQRALLAELLAKVDAGAMTAREVGRRLAEAFKRPATKAPRICSPLPTHETGASGTVAETEPVHQATDPAPDDGREGGDRGA